MGRSLSGQVIFEGLDLLLRLFGPVVRLTVDVLILTFLLSSHSHRIPLSIDEILVHLQGADALGGLLLSLGLRVLNPIDELMFFGLSQLLEAQ